MYHFSDSESVDSDEGVRYKTESIRNKQLNRERDRNRNNDGRNRPRSRSRSRSRHHEERKSKRKRDYSPEEKSSRRTSKSKYREHDRKYRTENVKSRKNDDRDDKISPQDTEKSKGDQSNKPKTDEGSNFQESTHNSIKNSVLQKKSIIDNPKHGEDCTQDILFGPSLPPVVSPKKTESEEEPRNENVFGPQLPPHLAKKPQEDNMIGPSLPSHFITVSSLEDENSNDSNKNESNKRTNVQETVIGPALPPCFLKQDEESIIGPTIPPHLKQQLENSSNETMEEEIESGVYGPLPVGAQFSQAHIELEERALKMKMDQLEPSGSDQPVREEWMLTLPEAKAAKFGMGPRQFRSKAGPDLSDRSSWTDTPEDKAKKKEGKAEPVIDLKREAELKQIESRNREQEKIAKGHRKEKDSLLESHQKKLKKEKKKESGPSERRPFSREIDLQVNRFDEAQKKAILKKAQLLDNRFSSGESKYL